jgi:hypothetical protein
MNARITIVEHAVRWSKNILTEVLHNHGKALTKERAQHLRTAIACLSTFESAKREEDHPDLTPKASGSS